MIKLTYIEEAAFNVTGTVYELDAHHPLALEKVISKIKQDGYLMGNITIPILMELYRADVKLVLPVLKNYISGLTTETNLILIGSTDLDEYLNVSRSSTDAEYKYNPGRTEPAKQVVEEITSRLDGVYHISGRTLTKLYELEARMVEIRNTSIYDKFVNNVPSKDIAEEYNLSPARVSQIVRDTINNKW